MGLNRGSCARGVFINFEFTSGRWPTWFNRKQQIAEKEPEQAQIFYTILQLTTYTPMSRVIGVIGTLLAILEKSPILFHTTVIYNTASTQGKFDTKSNAYKKSHQEYHL